MYRKTQACILEALSPHEWRRSFVISERIEEATGTRPRLGALFAALEELERAGDIERRVVDPPPELLWVRGDRRMAEYRLTPGGVRRRIELGGKERRGGPAPALKPA